jgi:Glycolipid transfer protein (GLTP)
MLLDETIPSKTINDSRNWTVGKVSFLMLLVFSMTDILLSLVDAQMDSLEAPDYYDALSADVIRPAFRYHTTTSKATTDRHGMKRKRMGLGSAAILSVTNALSPILPFTGGLGLRSENYWTNGLRGSLYSVTARVRNAFAGQAESTSTLNDQILTTRGGSTVVHRPSKERKPAHSTTISNTEPFMPLADIARLTLKDVSLAFRYAVESTRPTFNFNRFTSGLSVQVNDVFSRISSASAASRGKGVLAPITGVANIAGDVDALNFCAAMRIFAEWRVLRQVPEGYKGYSVGMTLGQKDIVQNVGKIEKAVHEWIEHHSGESTQQNSGRQLTSPTLRDLLQYEVSTGVHEKLPRLKEKSAAMGLLWVRRQLHYQTALFANVIQVPGRFDTARDAISAAYQEVYDRYHGWAVQKIFTYSFQAAPDTSEVYKVMNPERLKEVVNAAHNLRQDEYSTEKRTRHSENPIERLGRHMGREWEKMIGSLGHLFGQRRSLGIESVRGGSDLGNTISLQFEAFVNEQMARDAHEHIEAYLEVAKPILGDLAALMEEFNMDDPTKV